MSEYLVAVLSMASFAFATSASPGPVNIVAAMSGAEFGIKRSCSYVLGAALGFVTILVGIGVGFWGHPGFQQGYHKCFGYFWCDLHAVSCV